MPAEIEKLTERQAKLLAHMLHEIRPEWSIPSMLTLFEANAAYAPFDRLCEAAIKLARNPTKKLPILIFREGKHWLNDDQAANPAYTATIGADTSLDCDRHPGRKAWECKACEVRTTKPANFEELLQQAVEDARAERVGA